MYRPDSSEYRQQQQKLDEEGELGFFRTVFVSTGLFALFFVYELSRPIVFVAYFLREKSLVLLVKLVYDLGEYS